jgi:hypothetical protein
VSSHLKWMVEICARCFSDFCKAGENPNQIELGRLDCPATGSTHIVCHNNISFNNTRLLRPVGKSRTLSRMMILCYVVPFSATHISLDHFKICAESNYEKKNNGLDVALY